MKHLLIASGNRAWVWTLAESLCGAGYAVETAKSGIDCVDRIRATRPSMLVLSDELLWGGSDGVLDFLNAELKESARPGVLFVVGFAPFQTKHQVPAWVIQLPATTKLQSIVDAVRGHLSQEMPCDFESRMQNDVAKVRACRCCG